MGYVVENKNIEQVENEISKMKWAFIRYYSNVYLGKIPDSIDFDEIVEARFFDENSEIRIFENEGNLESCIITDDGIVETESVDLLPKFDGKMLIKKYIEFDEDGQGFIANTRMCGLEGGCAE